MKPEENLLGIFDSGVGGFSVLREVRKVADADICYFGDCARAPYGNKSEEEIVGYIKELLLRLQKRGVTHFVSACNSMSVHTTEMVLEEIGIPKNRYIDMVDAFGKIMFPADAKVLIIGTKATITSGVYSSILEVKKIPSGVFVPTTLAGEIEKNNMEAIRRSIASVLKEAIASGFTHIAYACTHYPLVDGLFKEEALRLSWKGEFIDPAQCVAEKIKMWSLEGSQKITFETSEETPVFKEYSTKVW